MVIDCAGPLLPGADPPIVPFIDDPLTSQEAQVRSELLAERLVLVALRNEHFDRRRRAG
jgi:hypothetical protein